MKLHALTATLAGLLALSGSASAQTITPDGHYFPAPQNGTVVMPATDAAPQTVYGTSIQQMSYVVPQMMSTTTYSMPSTTYSTSSTVSGVSYGSNEFFPSNLPGATILNGTTGTVRNVGTVVVTGTRRAVRRSLGILRR